MTGLAGTLGLRVLDNQGATAVARLATSVTEQPAGSGVYVRTGNVAPLTQGQYTLLWDDGAVTPGHVATEELNITYTAPGDPAPSSPGGPLCSTWITGADVAACGPDDLGVGTDVTQLDDAAYDASFILWELAGRRFPGDCVATVRPCRDQCGCWPGFVYGAGLGPWPVWGWGYDSIVGGWTWFNRDGGRCGCGSVSEVLLAGYPILEVTEVKIDGAIVDPAEYRLDDRRKLVRLDDPGPPVVTRRWPACQNITLPDTETGTWSVTYRWGGAPPPLGRMAAAQLARELWKACQPGLTCALPSKVTKVTKQGVTYERVIPIAAMLRKGSTGLPVVDAFIATVNPSGRRRAPLVWSPDRKRFPRRTG